MLYDYNHTSRVIHLDGRPHVGKDIRLFMGDSIGHWDGNTLIVDTTNFNGRIAYSREIPYLSDRCTRRSDSPSRTPTSSTTKSRSTIRYLFTKPWKIAGYFSRSPRGSGIAGVRVRRGQSDPAEYFWTAAGAVKEEITDEAGDVGAWFCGRRWRLRRWPRITLSRPNST